MVAVQVMQKYGHLSGVDVGPVDYAKYAEAFGVTGLMIRTADGIAPMLKKAMATEGPVIIGVQVDYRDNAKVFGSVDQNSIQ
jgi:acetolactate synthase-1/2/3 large subunit